MTIWTLVIVLRLVMKLDLAWKGELITRNGSINLLIRNIEQLIEAFGDTYSK